MPLTSHTDPTTFVSLTRGLHLMYHYFAVQIHNVPTYSHLPPLWPSMCTDDFTPLMTHSNMHLPLLQLLIHRQTSGPPVPLLQYNPLILSFQNLKTIILCRDPFTIHHQLQHRAHLLSLPCLWKLLLLAQSTLTEIHHPVALEPLQHNLISTSTISRHSLHH